MPEPANALKEKAAEWKEMAAVCYTRALSGDKEALALMRDAINEAADLFISLEFVE